ncbi:MAG: hypothetical protein LQ340_007548 [Diploschistes diacapsis]|nr:MAG: hypothetical protein LQ340_007548 [Diploschistes diacapsis]
MTEADAIDKREEETAGSSSNDPSKAPVEKEEEEEEEERAEATAAAAAAAERVSRFQALQARAKKAGSHNLKEAAAESQRLGVDQGQLAAMARRHATASHKLLKAEAEADGDDFERKRAWDWTVEESDRWDRRMAKKARNRDGVAFADYHQQSNAVYKRQIKAIRPDLEAYQRAKDEAVQRAAESGNLEIVETEDGELVAVDRDGRSYSTADGVGFVDKPDKAAVDRLVNDLKKADDARMRKRRDRGKGGDDPDVTFINDKNKQFNQKLARFYNKYTTEIRESFERGTAI